MEVISDMDRPHRVAVSGIYELPFGRGRRLLNSSNGVVSRIVGGWQLGGVYTFQSGAPINWGNIIFNGDVNNIKKSGDQQSVAQWINVNAGFERNAGMGSLAPTSARSRCASVSSAPTRLTTSICR